MLLATPRPLLVNVKPVESFREPPKRVVTNKRSAILESDEITSSESSGDEQDQSGPRPSRARMSITKGQQPSRRAERNAATQHDPLIPPGH